MENVLTDNEVVYYAVKVNGQIAGPKRQNSFLAEQDISRLPEVYQSIAEVVPVTIDGRELLLG